MKTIAVTILLVFLLGGCAAHRFPCFEQDHPYPQNPFLLEVRIPTRAATVSDVMNVEYLLANTTDVAISGCLENMDLHTFFGAPNSKGIPSVRSAPLTVFEHGAPFKQVFRLPPGTRMVWNVQVKVPEIEPGPAKFVGYVKSVCPGLWMGSVTSNPVEIVIQPRTSISKH